jgi:hypothetical protein
VSTKTPVAIDSLRESSKEFDGSIFELVQGSSMLDEHVLKARRSGRFGGWAVTAVGPYQRRMTFDRAYSHARDISSPEEAVLLVFPLEWL